ncbi:putative serine/threonine protein kinase [Trypanosoma conorhini]|uniref:Putative serine/threonine protein kinase n=1 Tax=Trypanosoma conorhini TaxID=83891 RepID=A0A3R7P7G5_9TRYP|nr:putative serine/threonine protein kinase [Trypanosoma conorhini]RNF13935.1 putative serine/threonine protein kinase [Trypanosoma conorhini]
MLLGASDHSRGATLPWCAALVDRVAEFRWGAAVPLEALGAARGPPGVPVDCPLLRLTLDAAREMCSAAARGTQPSGGRRWADSRQACSPRDDAHNCPFDFLCPIGGGSFGTVLLVQSRVCPTRFFAAKSVTRLLRPAACAPVGPRDGDEATLAALRQAFSGKTSEVASSFPALGEFLREARVAAALPPHPHISRCHGVLLSPGVTAKAGESASSALHPASSQTAVGAHLLMELGAGGTLGDLLLRHTCHIAEEHLVCWLGQLLRGLACLHKGGVIHRDIKPSNILVRRAASAAWESDTELFFVDFGISALVADANCATERTVMGSGVYCPPEIARYWGYRRRCACSCASDVWSTAALFYVFLTCGAASMDDGMAAVFSTSSSPAADAATTAQFRVARGEYPPLAVLMRVPLLDDDALRLAQERLAARRAGAAGAGGADGGLGPGAYTEYTTAAEEGTSAGGRKGPGGWPAWASSPGVQLMARRLRVRELSPEFLGLIDSMMAPDPAERPTAEAVLLDSPVFGMRLPWWEKVVEQAMRRVVGGVENVLLDVCVGDSDEEEEEDEEEAALVRRTMAPLVSPAENHGYAPHGVVHWWAVDLTGGEPDHTKWLPPTSLLAALLTTLRGLTGFEATGDAPGRVRREVTLYTATSLRFLERVCVPVRDADLSTRRVEDGPLFGELEARGLGTDFVVHVQARLRAVARAGQVLMRNGWSEEEDLADAEEMARRATEALVATTEEWLRHREAVTGVAALRVLPWVSWHLDGEAGGTGGDAPHCFTVEYVAAGPRDGQSQPAVCESNVTGDVAAVFRDWRANLTEALHRLSCEVHAAAADDVRDGEAPPVRCGGRAWEQSFRAVLGALEAAESELVERQKRNEAHHGLLRGHVVPWLSTRPAPSVERCVETLRGVRGGAHAASQLVQEWILTAIFTTEGAMALMPGRRLSGETDPSRDLA